jgi:dinuclear metal center YbgI/SA1388 family protein
MSIKIKDALFCLNKYFNEQTAEEWDNSGLLCGDTSQVLTHIIICLDITQAVLDLAIQKNINLIISHHPVIFKPFLPLTTQSYKGKILIDAIKHDICIYSAHTNVDKAILGINNANAKMLGLKNIALIPPSDMNPYKISAPLESRDQKHVLDILSKYNCTNITFYLGCDNKLVTEAFITEEMISDDLYHIMQETSLNFNIIPTKNLRNDVCNFIIGEIEPMNIFDFTEHVKRCFDLKTVAIGGYINRNIKKVAFCGGAGKSFLKEAIAHNIDVYITGDISHHDFQLAYESGILLIDATHYATEKVFLEIISSTLLHEDIGINKDNITLIEQFELFSKIV